jgi:hypothetical protein
VVVSQSWGETAVTFAVNKKARVIGCLEDSDTRKTEESGEEGGEFKIATVDVEGRVGR